MLHARLFQHLLPLLLLLVLPLLLCRLLVGLLLLLPLPVLRLLLLVVVVLPLPLPAAAGPPRWPKEPGAAKGGPQPLLPQLASHQEGQRGAQGPGRT